MTSDSTTMSPKDTAGGWISRPLSNRHYGAIGNVAEEEEYVLARIWVKVLVVDTYAS